MIGKYKIAHLIGVTRDREEQFRSAEKAVTAMGHIAFTPVFYSVQEYESFGPYPNMLDDMCTKKLDICDFLVLVTPDHVGRSTALRIRQAAEQGKKVYVLEKGELKEYVQAADSPC